MENADLRALAMPRVVVAAAKWGTKKARCPRANEQFFISTTVLPTVPRWYIAVVQVSRQSRRSVDQHVFETTPALELLDLGTAIDMTWQEFAQQDPELAA